MEVSTLTELYQRLDKPFDKVFVVPLIRYGFKKTDYLYLLYKDLIESTKKPIVESISVFGHYRFVLGALLSRRTVLHYHWVEFQDLRSLSAMPYKLLCIFLYKLFGGTLVWTVHNRIPHDKNFLKLHHRIHKWMGAKADLIHVHSETAATIVTDFLSLDTSKIVILKHPTFPAEELPDNESPAKFLDRYGYHTFDPDAPVLLNFGAVSEYKGLREIINLLKEKDASFTFIIAGYIKKKQEDLHRFIVDQTIEDERFVYINTFIPEKDLPYLFGLTDVCVFNYDEILTSGGVEMARSYQKKIIAPAMGGLLEYRNEENISLFNSPEELNSLLESYLNG